MRSDLSRLFLVLGASLAVLIIATAAWLALALLQTQNEAMALLVVAVLVTALIVYFVVLGLLTSRLGGNWIVWVGLTLLLSPPAILVAYVLVWRRVRAQNRG